MSNQISILNKNNIHVSGVAFLSLCVALLLLTRVFQYCPGFGAIQELGIIIPILIFFPTFLLLKRRIPKGQRWRKYDTYSFGFMVLLPIWAGIMAQEVHGQPWYFGALSMRGFGMILIGLLLILFLRAGAITLQHIDRALLACAWFSISIFSAMILFLDPADFVDDLNTLVEIRHGEGIRFKFSNVLPLYAFFSHGIRFIRERKWIQILPVGVLLAWMVGSAGGRILTIGIIVTCIIMLAMWGNLRSFLKGIGAVIISIILFISVGLLLDYEATTKRLDKFQDAVEVFHGDPDRIEDNSASSRILQVLIASTFIENSPFFGSGRISFQWVEGGYKGFIGEHFFPDDIGVIGVIVQFGFIGTLLIYMQFLFAFIMLNSWRPYDRGTKEDNVILSFSAFAIYESIVSLVNGDAMMYPELTLTLIAVIAYADQTKSLKPPIFSEYKVHTNKKLNITKYS